MRNHQTFIALSIFGLLAALPREVVARKNYADMVADLLKGKVIVMAKRPPDKINSPQGFVRALRVNQKLHIWPDKDHKKEWRYEFMAFFAKPLNDNEVTIKFYDVTEGKRFVMADTFYLNKGDRLFASNMVLKKNPFEVDRKYEMSILTARGALLAATNLWLRGEREHYSGKVTFTDDEARSKDP
jgi:hypothetical protein